MCPTTLKRMAAGQTGEDEVVSIYTGLVTNLALVAGCFHQYCEVCIQH